MLLHTMQHWWVLYPLLALVFVPSCQVVGAKRVQVFGFSIANTATYNGYDWSVLTTSSWKTDPKLVDLAEQHGAVVELNAGDVKSIMSDAKQRKAWVSSSKLKTSATLMVHKESNLLDVFQQDWHAKL